MNVLLIYPKYPKTFWSFEYALEFINKKSSFPPLGLLTIASMLPSEWSIKLIDLNITKLTDEQIKWADLVIISAMSIQIDSANEIIKRCKEFGVKVAGGGPLFNVEPEKFNNIDYLFLGEGEITIPEFINDLKNRKSKKVYISSEYADMTLSPIPKWELIGNINEYASMCIQFSRGCPFNCEFCNVTSLFGHKIRTKTTEQIINELNKIYELGWIGGVFFVDDNFIAAKKIVKNDLLLALIKWMKERNYPFEFFTQASINLSDDDEMIDLMIEAGFDTVFIGIETPNQESLIEVKKYQNVKRDLIKSVKKLHKKGLQVQAGFIVGFDNDPPDIFDRQINFIPKIDKEKLIKGYLKIVNTIYSPENYYQRLLTFLKDYTPPRLVDLRLSKDKLKAFFKVIIKLGIIEKERKYFFKVFFWTILKKIKSLPLAIHISITGYHFRKIFEEINMNFLNKNLKLN